MAERAEIIALERAFWRAKAAGEWDAAARMLTPRAASLAGVGAFHFTPEEFLALSRSLPRQSVNWDMQDEAVIFPTPDSAVITYRMRLTAGGHVAESWQSSVWLRISGDWRCAMHSESAVAAADGAQQSNAQVP